MKLIVKLLITILAVVFLQACNQGNVRTIEAVQEDKGSESSSGPITVISSPGDGFRLSSRNARGVFENSEILTRILDKKLKGAGIKLTGQPVIKVHGRFNASGKVGNIRKDLGELVQEISADMDPKVVEEKLTNTEFALFSNVGSLYSSTSALTGGYGSGLLLDVALNSLMNVSGLRGSLNKALTGDPRGICLFGCKNWNKSSQTVQLFAEITDGDKTYGRIRVQARSLEEELMPGKLLDASINKLIEEILM